LKTKAAWGEVARAAVVGAVVLGSAACSSSSSPASNDAGDDAMYYGSPPSDGSTDGEGGTGDGGPDGPTCIIPASATYSEMVPGGGMAGCSPQVANGQCDPDEFREMCSAPDPVDLGQPPSELLCNYIPGSTDPASAYYCCTCQGGGSADP
jgi:hypothetical protein